MPLRWRVFVVHADGRILRGYNGSEASTRRQYAGTNVPRGGLVRLVRSDGRGGYDTIESKACHTGLIRIAE